jgi:hypothetical protein
MRPATYHLGVRAARADALFASALQRSADPIVGQVRRAVGEAVRDLRQPGPRRVSRPYPIHELHNSITESDIRPKE